MLRTVGRGVPPAVVASQWAVRTAVQKNATSLLSRQLCLRDGIKVGSASKSLVVMRHFMSSATRFEQTSSSSKVDTASDKSESKAEEETSKATDVDAAGAEEEELEDVTDDGDPKTLLNEMRDLLHSKDEEVKKLTEQRARLLAEMENTRTIARRDVENATLYGIQKFAKNILEVADNLDRALDSIPADKLDPATNKYLTELHIGVEMTRKELHRALESVDVKNFPAEEGDVFDPNKHQAMFEAELPGKEAGTIVSVTKKGYVIGNRVLRAAEVGVAKGDHSS